MRRLVFALALIACGPAPRSGLGTQCERNSDCAAPLVCRLGYCRNECATSQDCAPPLACVRDEGGFGACQRIEEQSCSLESDCPSPLVCRLHQCVEQCAADRDCLGGAHCTAFPEGNACIDDAIEPCVADNECGAMRFCIAGRCRRQCYTDRDCRNMFWCDPNGVCEPPPRPIADAGPIDAGPIDAGPIDAGPNDAGPNDAGPNDAGPVDAGPVGACRGGPLANVVQLSVGRIHACALVDDVGVRRVYCWGVPPETGATSPTLCAAEVAGLAGMGVQEIAAGGDFTCVRDRAGQVECFGLNSEGELGRGAPPAPADPNPVPIAALVATSIAAGAGHACVHTSATTLECWGANTSGQLGDLSGTNQFAPVGSTFAPAATGIDLGRLHSCGLDGSLTPICWGDDTFGQLGNGGGATIIDATMVSAGNEHTCALVAGSVFCWGNGGGGRLGDGTTMSRNTRQPVVGLVGPASFVSAGGLHTCAIVSGDAYCWGWSDAIEGGAGHAVLTPTLTFTGVASIGGGDQFTCALTTTGEVECIGYNSLGELGDGTMTPRYTPAPVMMK